MTEKNTLITTDESGSITKIHDVETVEVKVDHAGRLEKIGQGQGPDGKFLAKEKVRGPRATEGKKAVELLRKMLRQKSEFGPRSVQEEGWKKIFALVNQMEDPKLAMSAVKAWELVQNRAFGKVEVSDDEKEARANPEGVRVVFIHSSANPDIPVIDIEDRPRPPEKPTWELTEGQKPAPQPTVAEVMEVKTNPAPAKEEKPKDDGFWVQPSKY